MNFGHFDLHIPLVLLSWDLLFIFETSEQRNAHITLVT